MRRLLSYYRQFDELSPDEISRELRARRDEERRRHPAEQPPLDLSGAAWHAPPHPEVVNAATFALRRAVNHYPDVLPLQTAIAASHDVAPERIVVGHGAGELLRSALRALAPAGEVAVAWPGWGLLPPLVSEAGATPVPVAPEDLAAHRGTIVVARPNDPTGAVMPLADVSALARGLADGAWLILDEALAGFLPDGEDGLVDHPRVLHVRSFSKAHAMAGFRVGYAVLPAAAPDLGLAPVLGVGAAAEAGALWAVERGAADVQRRRALAAAERARLAAALDGTAYSLAPGHGPYAWLAAPDGAELAEALAARRIFVAPGTAWGDERHVRVTLRDAAATDRLAAALLERRD